MLHLCTTNLPNKTIWYFLWATYITYLSIIHPINFHHIKPIDAEQQYCRFVWRASKGFVCCAKKNMVFSLFKTVQSTGKRICLLIFFPFLKYSCATTCYGRSYTTYLYVRIDPFRGHFRRCFSISRIYIFFGIWPEANFPCM